MAKKSRFHWEPKISDHNPSGGMTIIKCLPFKRPLVPAKFVEGSNAELNLTAQGLISQWNDGNHNSVIADWEAFVNHHAPQSDSALEFLAKEGITMEVPLFDSIFRGVEIITSAHLLVPDNYPEENDDTNDVGNPDVAAAEDAKDDSGERYGRLDNEVQTNTDSVRWDNRGRAQPFYPPRVDAELPLEMALHKDAYVMRTREQYADLIVARLSRICEIRGLAKTAANKDKLIDRLVADDNRRRSLPQVRALPNAATVTGNAGRGGEAKDANNDEEDSYQSLLIDAVDATANPRPPVQGASNAAGLVDDDVDPNVRLTMEKYLAMKAKVLKSICTTRNIRTLVNNSKAELAEKILQSFT